MTARIIFCLLCCLGAEGQILWGDIATQSLEKGGKCIFGLGSKLITAKDLIKLFKYMGLMICIYRLLFGLVAQSPVSRIYYKSRK